MARKYEEGFPGPGRCACGWNQSQKHLCNTTQMKWLTPPDYPLRTLEEPNSLKNPCNDVEELK